MRRWMLAVSRWLVGTLMVAGVALVGVALIPTMAGYGSMVVASGSMEPSVPVGSMALTRMVAARDLQRGDIVSVRHPGAELPVTHRVVAMDTEPGQVVVTTKGDANAAPDPELVVLESSADVAKVALTVPYAGYIVAFARTPAGGILFFLVPITGILLDDRRRQAQHARVAAAPRPCPECLRAGRVPRVLPESVVSPDEPAEELGRVITLPSVDARAPEVRLGVVDLTGTWAAGPRRRLRQTAGTHEQRAAQPLRLGGKTG